MEDVRDGGKMKIDIILCGNLKYKSNRFVEWIWIINIYRMGILYFVFRSLFKVFLKMEINVIILIEE